MSINSKKLMKPLFNRPLQEPVAGGQTRGISLLEIMMVIAVSAVAMIMAINYFTNVKMTSKINMATNQVGNLYQGTLSYYKSARYQAPQTSATELVNTLLNGSYITPNDIVSPWSSSAKHTVAMTLSDADNASKIIITVAAVPSRACNILNSRLKVALPPNTIFSTCPNTGTTNLAITIPF